MSRLDAYIEATNDVFVAWIMVAICAAIFGPRDWVDGIGTACVTLAIGGLLRLCRTWRRA